MAEWHSGKVLIALASAVTTAFSCLALGQSPPEPDGALAGPEVRERERPSIVWRNIYSELQRPEETPEEAVVRELDLSSEAGAIVEKVFLRRVRWIDGWVAGHAELLVRLKRADDGMPLADRIALVLEAIAGAEPLARTPSLWDQVRAELPAPDAPEFDRMMLEYWDAVAADGRARAPGVLERFAIISKERLEILGREIEKSLETLGDSGRLAVTALTSGMELSGVQRSQLAVMAADYDQSAEVPPTDDQKRALVLKVMSILGPEQRERVLAMIGGG